MKKKIVALLLAVAMLFMFTACGQSKEEEEGFDKVSWPTIGLALRIPKPANLDYGLIKSESSTSFHVVLGKAKKSQFNDYVNKCMSKGYTKDYSKGSYYYFADDKEGYHVSVYYKDSDIYDDYEYDEPTLDITISDYRDINKSSKDTSSDKKTTVKTTAKKTTKKSSKTSSGVSKKFKKTMDSYEDFFDSYIKFMKKYNKAKNVSAGMLKDFTNYMTKYEKVMNKLDKIDEDDLSVADAAYYNKVMLRITTKLSKANL